MGKMVPMGLEGTGYTQSRLRVSGGGPLGSSSRLRMPDGMYMVIGRPRRNIFTEMPSTEKRGGGVNHHPEASLQESQSRILPTTPHRYPKVAPGAAAQTLTLSSKFFQMLLYLPKL